MQRQVGSWSSGEKKWVRYINAWIISIQVEFITWSLNKINEGETNPQETWAGVYSEGFPGGTVVKNPSANAGDASDVGSVSEWGRSPRIEEFLGVGNSNPLQYSYLENSLDLEAWQATIHGVAKNQTTERSSKQTGRQR